MKKEIETITTVTRVLHFEVSFLHDFLDFLREQGALIEFVEAFETLNRVDPEAKMKQLISDEIKPDNWISGAFRWSESKQGHQYWSFLSSQWESFLEGEIVKAREEGKCDRVVWKGVN